MSIFKKFSTLFTSSKRNEARPAEPPGTRVVPRSTVQLQPPVERAPLPDAVMTPKRERILTLIDELDDIPTLPAVAQQVISMAHDLEVNYRELKKLVMTDPPLAAKLIKVANSAIMGRREPTTDIEQALVTLGLENILYVCNTMGVLGSITSWGSAVIDRKKLWRHSLATGFLAKSFQMRKTDASRGPDLYLCGLLHHIGWILLDHLDSGMVAEVHRISEELPEGEKWSIEFERELMGIDHSEAGGHFLRKWGLPTDVATVVEGHHYPSKAGDLSSQAGIIELATALSPHKYEPDVPFEVVEKTVPHRLQHPAGMAALREMHERYKPNIEQSGKMADVMLAWV